MGKMEMPLPQHRSLLTLPAESGGRTTDPHMGTLQFALGSHFGIVSAAQEAERVGIFISHFRDGEVNCLHLPQSQGAPEQGWASPRPAVC